MQVLITSGGTQVPIDPIRCITNSSTGQLGSQIAIAALLKGASVIYLASIEAKSPFYASFDCYSSFLQKNSIIQENYIQEKSILKLKELFEFYCQYHDYYSEFRFRYYEEYSALLKKIIIEKKPDVVILVAAVSDYLINSYSPEKIRSTDELQLQFKIAPKLIHYIKK